MILALESATTACSAALCAADGSVVAERVYLEGPAHAQRLLAGVREVLEETGAGWADVDTVAVSLGPGAFTGLRIGVATARALAQADGRVRLAGVPTLACLALAIAGRDDAAADLPVVPLVDGRRREVFAAVYAWGEAGATGVAGLRLVRDVAVVPAEALRGWLDGLGDCLAGGDGVHLYADRLPPSARRVTAVAAPTAAMVGRAVAVGVPGLVFGPDDVLPLYGRAPDAARWQGGEGRP